MVEESKAKDFETYLISALNDSLLKKSKFKYIILMIIINQ